jgi:hypothetical protein
MLLIGLVAACASPAPSAVTWLDRVPEAAPEAVADQPVVARGRDTITLAPISPRGAVVGIPYDYDMPHCGINGAIDVDGTYWDAVDIAPDSVDFDGAVGTFRLRSAATAVFTGSDGRALELVRHEGVKQFPGCL